MNDDRITIQQAALFTAQLLISLYFTIILIILIAVGLVMAFYYPDWTPLEAFR